MSGGSVEPTAGANINRRGSVAEIGSHSATSGDITRSGGIPSSLQIERTQANVSGEITAPQTQSHGCQDESRKEASSSCHPQ